MFGCIWLRSCQVLLTTLAPSLFIRRRPLSCVTVKVEVENGGDAPHAVNLIWGWWVEADDGLTLYFWLCDWLLQLILGLVHLKDLAGVGDLRKVLCYFCNWLREKYSFNFGWIEFRWIKGFLTCYYCFPK